MKASYVNPIGVLLCCVLYGCGVAYPNYPINSLMWASLSAIAMGFLFSYAAQGPNYVTGEETQTFDSLLYAANAKLPAEETVLDCPLYYSGIGLQPIRGWFFAKLAGKRILVLDSDGS